MRITPEEHAAALELEILSGVLRGRTRLGYEEWTAVVKNLIAADARVVVLKMLHEMTNDRAGDYLGVSHGMIHLRWHRAIERMGSDKVCDILSELRERETAF